MVLSEVLLDACWCLRREDLEAFLLADKAHSDIIGSYFQKTGPRRLISFAELTYNIRTSVRAFSVSSSGEEKNASSIEEFSCFLLNSFVERFSLNYAVMNETTANALRRLKDAYELDSLEIEFYTSPRDTLLLRRTLNDAFCCREVSCNFHYSPHAENDSIIVKELMSTFTSSLTLWGTIPPCDSSLIAEWLNSATSDAPRSLNIWSSSCEFDAPTLVGFLTEKFARDTCSREYEFLAGVEYIGYLGCVMHEDRENANGEVLEIKTVLETGTAPTDYCELSIKRLKKYDTSA
ncbi:hypothetical protein AAVH_28814 [Aphelenchoides avenae]|nr:hypothetical protein AAVH_28814 [Aphelenchus avenae]